MPNELSHGRPWGKTDPYSAGGKSDTGFTNALRNAMKPNTRKKNSINLSRPQAPTDRDEQRTLSSSPQRTLSSSPQRTLSSSPMPKSLKQSKR